jgi:hypothetical protein
MCFELENRGLLQDNKEREIKRKRKNGEKDRGYERERKKEN